MKYLLHHSRLQHLIQHRNGYLSLACGSLILNILLSIGIFTIAGNERVVVVPPSINKSFWVDANQVSPEYLSEMSLFFASLRFNITPTNAAMQRELLVRYVHPHFYEALKAELISEEEHIKKEHVTTSFYPVNVVVDSKKMISQITGDLQSSVGDAQLPLKRLTYQINFSYNNGRLLVKSFEEVKKDA